MSCALKPIGLVVSVVLLTVCTGCGKSPISPRSGATSALLRDFERADFYTKEALRDFGPHAEMIYAEAPRPESVADVAGVFFRAGSLVTQADAQLLNGMDDVFVLSVSRCRVSQVFWSTLDFSGLKYLYADESNLSDSDCVYFGKADSLVFVSVHKTPVTRKGKLWIESAVPGVHVYDWYR